MNNKGQALVVFVILLPVILLLMAGIVDIGNFLATKNEYENEVKSAIKYGMKHLDEDNTQKLYRLLDSNIDGDKEVIIQNNTIKISVTASKESLFKKIIDFDYQIDISYLGYMDNGKVKIRKE